MKILEKIESIILKIDWKSIQAYHEQLNIFWEIEEKTQKQLKIPSEIDLQNELRSILQYMYEEKIDYISYGQWVIFWNMYENQNDYHFGQIRVIFRISDYTFTEEVEKNPNIRGEISQLNFNELENLLKLAVDEENYEEAIIIRDSIINLNKIR